MPRTSPEAIAKWKSDSSARIVEQRRRVYAIKEERQCVDCPPGTWWPYFVLQFDHLPQFEKTRDISAMMGHSWEKILAEIAKCEIVCASHHAIRTQNRL